MRSILYRRRCRVYNLPMKRIRKRQLLFLGINISVLIILFFSLRVYDLRFREPPVLFDRPIVAMEKIAPSENPYFSYFDRMELFTQYRGTRAVGSEKPGEMVLLVAPPGYDRYLHFSHLLYEAYRENIGLVIMDFADVRHFIPLDVGEDIPGNDGRMVLFVRTMIAYMKQYGFTNFSVVYLGMDPPPYIREGLADYRINRISGEPPEEGTPFNMAEEVKLIDSILAF